MTLRQRETIVLEDCNLDTVVHEKFYICYIKMNKKTSNKIVQTFNMMTS